MCRGMISGGLGDERERAPLDSGRRGRINPLAGACWGFLRLLPEGQCECQAVGKSSHADIRTLWLL